MCGRYHIDAEEAAEEIAVLIEEMNRRESGKPEARTVKTGEIFPGDEALVVANSRARRARPFLMRWGFSMDKRLLINARSETAAEKALFEPLLRERRLLVPASGYYEWEKRGKERVKYELSANHGAVFMAGIYRLNGDQAEFVILTRDAAPGIAFIHDRMPVIFSGEAAREWLSPDGDPLRLLALAEDDVRFQRAEGEAPAQTEMDLGELFDQ